MTVCIALLRGINVGGRNIVPMAELRQHLADAGLGAVKTYIQSGNVVFEARRVAKTRLATTIRKTVQAAFDVSADVLVLSAAQLDEALARNPFASVTTDEKTVHLFFLAARPSAASVSAARELLASTEACELIGNVFYLYAPDGIARSRFAARAETTLGVSATARNLRSSRKIRELAAAIAD